ncbi:WD40 repeat-like protein [Microthyrium microscopicum]|uniref:WD40 repeat-like protein n=1 Tax=Microthyrium microscopicum TaxID=703497 RepID=A0A6A6TW41_9PEZI|nr:WD40 repeat-like protein [Microthyrium microscopicum]
MSGLFGSAAATSASNSQGDLKSDIAVRDPPSDSVSEIAFHPSANFLAASSWDNKVRIYEIDQSGNSQGKAIFELEAPALSVAWSLDGNKCVAGGADKTARILDVGSGATTAQQVAAHDEPIKCVKFFETGGNQMLVTGSWDKKIRYWDLRQQTPAASVDLKERVYSMDVRGKLLVLGLAERFIDIFNLDKPTELYKTITSPLKWQTRVVSCYNDQTGYAVGSIEGRCAMQYVDEKDQSLNFSFKCHRVTDPNDRNLSKVYSVNAISWHPKHGTFSTAGSDGTYHFWDKDAKHRLKGYPEVGGPIVSTSFNHTGEIFAYAVSYDWSKGFNGHSTTSPNKIMLHPVTGDECKPRPGTKKR